MDGCNQSGSITRQLIKISNAYGSSSKKVAVLSTKMLSKIIRYKASINGGLRDTFATNTVSLEKMDDCNCSLKKKKHLTYKYECLMLILPVRLKKWMAFSNSSLKIKWHATLNTGQL